MFFDPFQGYNDVRVILGMARINSMEEKPPEIEQEVWEDFKKVCISIQN